MNRPPDPVLAAWRAYLTDCDRASLNVPTGLYSELLEHLDVHHADTRTLPTPRTGRTVVDREQLVAVLNDVKEMGGTS